MKKGIFQKNFISAGLFFVLALSLVPIAILYGNEAQRNMVLFLCSLGSCAAVSLLFMYPRRTVRINSSLLKLLLTQPKSFRNSELQ